MMGHVGTSAGGGRVTTTGLLSENIKAGETVTVKQGSKIVQNITGTLEAFALFYGTKFFYPSDGYANISLANTVWMHNPAIIKVVDSSTFEILTSGTLVGYIMHGPHTQMGNVVARVYINGEMVLNESQSQVYSQSVEISLPVKKGDFFRMYATSTGSGHEGYISLYLA